MHVVRVSVTFVRCIKMARHIVKHYDVGCVADRLRLAGGRYLGEGGGEELWRNHPERGAGIIAGRRRLGDHRCWCCRAHPGFPRLLRCHSREPVYAGNGNSVLVIFTFTHASRDFELQFEVYLSSS